MRLCRKVVRRIFAVTNRSNRKTQRQWLSKTQTGNPKLPTGKRCFQEGFPPSIFEASTANESNQNSTKRTIMKNLRMSAFAALLLALGTPLSAQTTATWQGGKPGRTTDWNCPANWSAGRIPDEFSEVIIPAGLNFYPIFKNEVMPIDALMMEAGTFLTLQNGAVLQILGETGWYDVIALFGTITNNGILAIGKVGSDNILLQHIRGNGRVVNLFSSIDTLASGQ